MTEVTHEVEPESASTALDQYTPSVYLEISKEQLDMLEVGKNVNINLLGKVKSLSANEADKANNRYEISLELKTVKIDPEDNEFGELAKDDD